jgi:hypothetical protein
MLAMLCCCLAWRAHSDFEAVLSLSARVRHPAGMRFHSITAIPMETPGMKTYDTAPGVDDKGR